MNVQEQVTRILVVDDHPVSMRGICMIIDGEPDMSRGAYEYPTEVEDE